jgi:hypothetical protein
MHVCPFYFKYGFPKFFLFSKSEKIWEVRVLLVYNSGQYSEEIRPDVGKYLGKFSLRYILRQTQVEEFDNPHAKPVGT